MFIVYRIMFVGYFMVFMVKTISWKAFNSFFSAKLKIEQKKIVKEMNIFEEIKNKNSNNKFFGLKF